MAAIPRTNEDLVRLVAAKSAGYLGGLPRPARILDAMRATDRALFLPPPAREDAYADLPVPIGFGQTCSEPSMVAFMLDLLDLWPGMRVLEVGAGCGYAAAVAARLCSPGGLVVAAEILPGLAALAAANLEAAGPANVEIVAGDGSEGLAGREAFDRILVSAGARAGGAFSPHPLLERLSAEGVLVYPEARGSLVRLARRGAGLERDEWRGVAFVPLTGRNA